MLVTLQEIIGMAEKGNYCIPAFNVYNTETVMGVFDAAEEAKAPVIMQVYPRLFNEYVEGELGHIGSVNDDAMDEFTSPEEAAEFVKQVDVTCLAVLVGNAHGHYKKPPKLDIERIAAIRKATGGIPLVLHGGSGIPDDQVKAAINAGIRKMNIGTDVCCAFADGTLESLNDPNRSLAVDMFMKKPIESVKKLALSKIALTGADGKAR